MEYDNTIKHDIYIFTNTHTIIYVIYRSFEPFFAVYFLDKAVLDSPGAFFVFSPKSSKKWVGFQPSPAMVVVYMAARTFWFKMAVTYLQVQLTLW